MFRLNDSIRLTPLDYQLFARVAANELAPPTTVSDYNGRLAVAARMWSCGTSAGELMLAQMARDLMLDPADPTDVLGERHLAKRQLS